MPTRVKEPPKKDSPSTKNEGGPKGTLLEPPKGKEMMKMVSGTSKKAADPLAFLGKKNKEEEKKDTGTKKEEKDKKPGEEKLSHEQEHTGKQKEKEGSEKNKKTDTGLGTHSSDKEKIKSGETKNENPVERKLPETNKIPTEASNKTIATPEAKGIQGPKKGTVKTAAGGKNKTVPQSKTAANKTTLSKTSPEKKDSTTITDKKVETVSQGTGNVNPTGTGNETVTNENKQQNEIANPDIVKKPEEKPKEDKQEEIKPVPQKIKPKAGIKHDKRVFNVAGELAKLKKEKTRVKSVIDNSGKTNISKVKADGDKEKATIASELKAKTDTGFKLFDNTILRIQLAVMQAKISVSKHKDEVTNRVNTDEKTQLAALDKVVIDKQTEGHNEGENYAKQSEDFGTKLSQDVKSKTFAQTNANEKNAASIAEKYKKNERYERIKADLAEMATKANDPLNDEEKKLTDAIKEKADDMAEDFRDSAEDLTDDLPDGKDDVADKITGFKDDALLEVEKADTSALDALQKNSEEVIVYLKQQKANYIAHLNTTAKDANSAIDTKVSDFETGINKYLTDTDASLDNIVTDTEKEIAPLPGSLAIQYIKNSIDSVHKAEASDKKTMPDTVKKTQDALKGISVQGTGELQNSYNSMLKPMEDTASGMEKKATETSGNINKAYDQSADKALEGMKEAIQKYSDGLDDAIKKAIDGWKVKLDEGKKELQDKADETTKNGDVAVADMLLKMTAEAIQIEQEWEATYWVRTAVAWAWDMEGKIASIVLSILKWVLIIVGAIIAVILLIVAIILLLPEEIGVLFVAFIELIITFVTEILSFVFSVITEDILGSTGVRLLLFYIFAKEGAGKIYDAFTKQGISGRERLDLFFGGLFDIGMAVVSEWKVVKGIFWASEGAKNWEAVLKLLGGDEKLGKTLMAYEKTEGELAALLTKIPGPEIEKLLLKSESLAEIDKGLELVNGNAKLLDDLLLQCDSMKQLERLMGRVENPAELERLLTEAGGGPELENLLKEFPKKTAAELEKSSFESLKNELKAKDKPGGDVVEGSSKHPGKYKDKPIIDAEHNLVAKTKAKDGHDVGVDVNGEPVVCTYCTPLRNNFKNELADSNPEIDQIKKDMERIDGLPKEGDQAREYADIENRLKEYKDRKLPVPTEILNGKGIPYPKVNVEGYGEVPFPKGPYTPNNTSLLRPSFTTSYKLKFKDWWLKQGRPWPEASEGSIINVHHIKPLSKGGTNAFDNLVPLIQPEEHGPFTSWWPSFK